LKNWLRWKEAIYKDFRNMKEKDVWEHCLLEHVPKDRMVVGDRWVMAEKDNGRLRTKNVVQDLRARQYFEESHAPSC
jgi:hypothetical protein